jgi:3-oxoacyl-[acyl-carrier protein] reductase
MTDKQGRVALVTGAARGIGLGIAERLAQDGAHVVLSDVLPEVHEAAERLRKAGLLADAEVGSVADEAWARSVVQGIEARHSRLDILVNNAGISPKRDGKKYPVQDTPLAQWNEVLAVNLTGAFLLCREAVPGMTNRGWGRIIMISSQAARTRADIAGSAYAAAKAGMIALSRVLASEVGKAGVTVNCIAPGRIESPMQAVAGEEATREYVNRIPVGRIGKPADIAATVAFLASDEASFITGATIDVNGGYFMG